MHITGAVKNEGIVEVKENSRINDAINAAGGTTEEADLSDVNLAYEIEDGQKIYIPSVKDKEEQKEVIISEAGEKVLEGQKDRSESKKVNINTATKEKLTELPGIGSSTASKIITYREENGKFKNIQDIKNVSGIGESKYESIKDYISI